VPGVCYLLCAPCTLFCSLFANLRPTWLLISYLQTPVAAPGRAGTQVGLAAIECRLVLAKSAIGHAAHGAGGSFEALVSQCALPALARRLAVEMQVASDNNKAKTTSPLPLPPPPPPHAEYAVQSQNDTPSANGPPSPSPQPPPLPPRPPPPAVEFVASVVADAVACESRVTSTTSVTCPTLTRMLSPGPLPSGMRLLSGVIFPGLRVPPRTTTEFDHMLLWVDPTGDRIVQRRPSTMTRPVVYADVEMSSAVAGADAGRSAAEPAIGGATAHRTGRNKHTSHGGGGGGDGSVGDGALQPCLEHTRVRAVAIIECKRNPQEIPDDVVPLRAGLGFFAGVVQADTGTPPFTGYWLDAGEVDDAYVLAHGAKGRPVGTGTDGAKPDDQFMCGSLPAPEPKSISSSFSLSAPPHSMSPSQQISAAMSCDRLYPSSSALPPEKSVALPAHSPTEPQGPAERLHERFLLLPESFAGHHAGAVDDTVVDTVFDSLVHYYTRPFARLDGLHGETKWACEGRRLHRLRRRQRKKEGLFFCIPHTPPSSRQSTRYAPHDVNATLVPRWPILDAIHFQIQV